MSIALQMVVEEMVLALQWYGWIDGTYEEDRELDDCVCSKITIIILNITFFLK